jgi:predicted transcriptional regulator
MKSTAKTKVEETGEAAEFEAAVREGLAEADAGKTIPYAKIRRWLLSWGSGKELPPPK